MGARAKPYEVCPLAPTPAADTPRNAVYRFALASFRLNGIAANNGIPRDDISCPSA